MGEDEFRRLVEGVMVQLGQAARNALVRVTLKVVDHPSNEDLHAVDPPFPPTILGLFKGVPLDSAESGARSPRTIFLYRRNLMRSATTISELQDQVRITLLHEVGHLFGDSEADLRDRGLE